MTVGRYCTVRSIRFPWHRTRASQLISFGELGNGALDAGVSPATTEVSAETFMNLFPCGIGMFIEESLGGHYESGGAESALLSIVIDECR